MNIGNETIDHIEIYDHTGQIVAMISDDEVVENKMITVKLCETDVMFKEDVIK